MPAGHEFVRMHRSHRGCRASNKVLIEILGDPAPSAVASRASRKSLPCSSPSASSKLSTPESEGSRLEDGTRANAAVESLPSYQDTRTGMRLARDTRATRMLTCHENALSKRYLTGWPRTWTVIEPIPLISRLWQGSTSFAWAITASSMIFSVRNEVHRDPLHRSSSGNISATIERIGR